MHSSRRKFSPHRSRRLLLQPRMRRCDGRARHSVDRHTVSSMPPFFLAVLARLTMRLPGFVTNPRERCGLRQRPLPACRRGSSGGSDSLTGASGAPRRCEPVGSCRWRPEPCDDSVMQDRQIRQKRLPVPFPLCGAGGHPWQRYVMLKARSNP
jgi:hypothetical protein